MPVTVQTEVDWDAKATGKPEEAVAVTVVGGPPSGRLGSDPKMMLCAERAITMLNACVASGPIPFAAANEPANVPAVLGVPSTIPNTESSERPGGSIPVATEKVGAGLPVAVATKRYGALTVPLVCGPLVNSGGWKIAVLFSAKVALDAAALAITE